jgi:K+-sensing histidine kinase KdpD
MSNPNDNNKIYEQFEILRAIVVSSSAGEKPLVTADIALKEAGRLIGLSAATVIMWDEGDNLTHSISFADNPESKRILQEIEEEVFGSIRKRQTLVSAYISFGGEKPLAGFTHPLKKGEKVFGAVIGIQPGVGSLTKEDIFLEAFAGALSVSFISGADIKERKEPEIDVIRKARLDAIKETAATVGHNINNPLTVVIGNIQLLLRRSGELDEETLRKLRTVEKEALRIERVTKKLIEHTSDAVTEYIPGEQMLDLSDDENTL